MKISWSYIAGFWDGEGCIVSCKRGSERQQFRASVVQGGDEGHLVLSEIQAFLNEHEILSHLQKRKGVNKPIYSLTIDSRHGVARFLSFIFPYLRVKRILAQDTMRYLILYPSLKHAHMVHRNPMHTESARAKMSAFKTKWWENKRRKDAAETIQ